jgi:uncharacterized protein YkwD
MNYIDLLILTALALFVWLGYLRGFLRAFTNLTALIAAIWLASATYAGVASWLSSSFGLPESFAPATGFFLVWFLVELAYYALLTLFSDKIPTAWRNFKYNKWLGLLPGAAWGCFIVWFAVNLIYIFTVSGSFKADLDNSFMAKKLTKNNHVISDFLGKTFGSAASGVIDFLTINPENSESISLGFTTRDVKSDNKRARAMLDLINEERTARNLKVLTFDEDLAGVGDAHCRDMFARGYFSHNSPEGETPFDRMNKAGLVYLVAGENLALAPTVEEAFLGLMNSPGHKANMLSPEFGRVGIAAVDGGKYGIMFAQEFAN